MGSNFKSIKDSVSKLLFEGVVNKLDENKKIYKKFINEVKASPILKTLYVVYNNIETEKFEDRDVAEVFLNENLVVFAAFTKQELISENNKIIQNVIKENLSSEPDDILFDLILESCKDRKLSDLNKKAKLFNQVLNTMIVESVNVKEDDEIIDFNILKRAVEILNDKFSFLTENEKSIVKAFINEDDELKEELYTELINENLNIIKRKLIEDDESDEDLTNTLNLTESKLQDMKYTKDIDISEYSKLIELKENLK